MADIITLNKEVKSMMTDFLKLKEKAMRDRRITPSESKSLAGYLTYLTQKRAELTILVELEKNPKVNKEQILAAIGQTLYKQAVKLHTESVELFKRVKLNPSYYIIAEWELIVANYKIEEQGFASLMNVYTGVYQGSSRAKMMIVGWAADLKNKEADFVKAEKELVPILENLRLKQLAATQTKADADSVDQVKDIKGMLLKFNGLVDRMHTTQDNILVHFVGWQKASNGICIAHTKAEEKYKALMKAQDDETTKEAALRAIALNVALTIGNIIFPGLSTPISTLLKTVLSPVLDEKVTEYKDSTIKIGKSIKSAKIGQAVEKANAAKFVGDLSAIAKHFDGISTTLKLGTSKTTQTSNFVPSNAAQSLLKYNTEICTMIHEAAEKVLTLENICQDIATRVENISSYKIFEDENVDMSASIDSLKELYKTLSKAVNTVHKSKDKLAPPKLGIALYEKPGDSEIFKQFLNMMLLKWIPAVELSKQRVVVKYHRISSTRIAAVQYKEFYKDYPSLIATEVKNAIVKYCGIDAALFKGIPYNTYTDWKTFDKDSDAAIKKLITAANGKIKGMESTSVWKTALGL